MRVLSYNIWFDKQKRQERLLSLVEIIKKERPDVICLQEVIPLALKCLRTLLPDYSFYPGVLDSYGVVIGSKHPIINKETYLMNRTEMNRRMSVISIDVDGTIVNIATIHFESEFEVHNNVKRSQFRMVEKLLSKHENVILCADTNICNDDDDKYFDTVFRAYRDAWKECGNSDNEFTYDYIKNKYISSKGQLYRSRLDRILYKGSVDCTKFEHVDYDDIQPSDHEGIMTVMEIANY